MRFSWSQWSENWRLLWSGHGPKLWREFERQHPVLAAIDVANLAMCVATLAYAIAHSLCYGW